MYRVRKSWDDTGSQLGAFEILSNAKVLADDNEGYKVFDSDGKQIYPVLCSKTDSKVTVGAIFSTVWNQHNRTGAYASELSKHGCGVCCCAVAASLKGVSTTPEKVMAKAIAVLGKKKPNQIYAISTKGAATVLGKLGLTGKMYAVTSANQATIKKKINTALRSGNPVICFTHAYDSSDPFAGGDHYVLACGYNKSGNVVIANSGGSKRTQAVTLDKLCRYLYHSCTGKDTGWMSSSAASAGIVIVKKGEPS